MCVPKSTHMHKLNKSQNFNYLLQIGEKINIPTYNGIYSLVNELFNITCIQDGGTQQPAIITYSNFHHLPQIGGKNKYTNLQYNIFIG